MFQDVAKHEAKLHGLPLLVAAFVLTTHPYPTARRFKFWLEGLRDTQRELRAQASALRSQSALTICASLYCSLCSNNQTDTCILPCRDCMYTMCSCAILRSAKRLLAVVHICYEQQACTEIVRYKYTLPGRMGIPSVCIGSIHMFASQLAIQRLSNHMALAFLSCSCNMCCGLSSISAHSVTCNPHYSMQVAALLSSFKLAAQHSGKLVIAQTRSSTF